MGCLRQQAAQLETLRLGHLARPRRVVGAHPVGLVNDGDLPGDVAELLHEFLAAGDLVHPDDEVIVLGEDVAALGVVDHLPVEHLEPQVELGSQLLPPLLDQAARGDDDGTLAVRAQDELLDVEPGHDRLPGARVVGEQETQWDARQHLLVDRPDLVRQRIDVGTVDSSHRVVEGGVLDAQRLSGQLEIVRGGVEGRCSVFVGDLDQTGYVGVAHQAGAAVAYLVAVEHLDQSGLDGIDGDHSGRLAGHQPPQVLPGP